MKVWRKGHICALVAEMWIGAATMENSMEGPQKLNKTTIWSSNATSVYLSEKKNENTKLKRYMHLHVYLVWCAKFNMWKQPKCSSFKGWIKKVWYACAMEDYSALK